MTFIFGLGGVTFFLISAAFVALCERLREGGS
ncbi:hypothetical protein AEAC466_16245 [Asticcacaulis sp. AC466]|nr:hypothetical protein AEAC466_16245 [Asticcacaulis sp. AC466]